MKNYYEILSISKNATDIEIKKAFRKLALQYHPDKNKSKDAHNIFVQINIAYETLKNIEKREEYNNKLSFNKKNDTYNYKEKSNRETKEKAEEYANMSYEQFEDILENLIYFGKKAKKTAKKGCGWVLAIILIPIGVISLLAAIIRGEIGLMILPLIFIFFGYAGYIMTDEE
jgi:curved DNA-binding protein CbpA